MTSHQLLWLLVSINKTQLGCNYSILRGVYVLSLFAGYTIVMDPMPHGRNVQINYYVLGCCFVFFSSTSSHISPFASSPSQDVKVQFADGAFLQPHGITYTMMHTTKGSS